MKIIGAATKSAMVHHEPNVTPVCMKWIAGIVDHQPSEFLITALAGTTIDEMQTELAKFGQYLPFDPPFAAQGATIGGTVAAGLSGAGRLRFGGLRDFIVGIRVVDGLGNVVTGGGRVVKNAAGYDLPKLMVGSAGYLSAIVEVTMKVFPRPTTHLTLRIDFGSFEEAFGVMKHFARSPIELAAMDLTPDGVIWLRVEGAADAIEATTQRVRQTLARLDTKATPSVVHDDVAVWGPLADGAFASQEERFVRVPTSPAGLLDFEASLGELCVRRRYSVAGNLAWIAWPVARPVQQLDDCLRHHALGGTVLTGDVVRYRIGVRPHPLMMGRVKRAMDPDDRFDGCA
jgi:glycolate oxidase FAD binding subunit